MKLRGRLARWLGLIALIALRVEAAAPQASPPPAPSRSAREAVEFREFQASGDRAPAGRLLRKDAGPLGIDIDSTLRIHFDREKLAAILIPAVQEEQQHTAQLRERIQKLTAVAETIPRMAELAQTATRAFAKGTQPQYEQALAAQSEIFLNVLETLEAAIQARLESDGQTHEAAAEATQKTMAVFLQGKAYDYKGFGQAFVDEIAALNRELTALLDARAQKIGVDLRVHLVRKDGSSVAVHLPGYNDEAVGPARAFPRLQVELSAEEQAAFKDYEELARKVGEAKDAGEALKKTFGTVYDQKLEELRQKIQAVNTAFQAVGVKIRGVADTFEPKAFTDWQNQNAAALDGQPKLKAALTDVGADFATLRKQLDELARLQNLATLSPLEVSGLVRDLVAVDTGLLNLNQWPKRREHLKALVEAAKALPAAEQALKTQPGPLKAVLDAQDAFATLVDSVKPLMDDVDRLYKFLNAGAFSVVSDLPEPLNQRRRQANQSLDTSADLQTIRSARAEGDSLLVTHRYYVGDELVEQIEDRFILNAYGFQSQPLAGLAFWRADGAGETWKPTPCISWVLNYRGWPGGNDTGLRTAWTNLFGIGVSALSLDFDPTKDVELGLAASLSLFNNFAQVGYGLNLNVSGTPGFWFFSIRPLELGNLFSSPPPSKS